MPELFRTPIKLNAVQKLQQQAALRLHYEGFDNSLDIINELREPLIEIKNAGVNQLRRRPEVMEYNVAAALRNTLFRAMGARAAAPVIPTINTLLDGKQPPEAPLAPDKNIRQYDGDRDRRYTGNEAILAPIIQETLVTLQAKEMAALSDKEYDGLQTAFAITTTQLRATAAKLLDADYGTQWRTRTVLQKPFEALQYPTGPDD